MPYNPWDFMGNLRYERDRKENAVNKLRADARYAEFSVGQRVVFAAGAAGRGFDWERIEGKVVEVGDTSVKVEFMKSYDKELSQTWMPFYCITDVLADREEPRNAKD